MSSQLPMSSQVQVLSVQVIFCLSYLCPLFNSGQRLSVKHKLPKKKEKQMQQMFVEEVE